MEADAVAAGAARLVAGVPPRLPGHEQRHVRFHRRPRAQRDIEPLEWPHVSEEERHVAAFEAEGALRIVAAGWDSAELVHGKERAHHPPPTRTAPRILRL